MRAIEAIKQVDWRDVAVRAVWTALQAFLAVFIFAGESIIDLLFDANWEALSVLIVATAVSALAAGLSAVKTVVLEVLRQLRSGVN